MTLVYILICFHIVGIFYAFYLCHYGDGETLPSPFSSFEDFISAIVVSIIGGGLILLFNCCKLGVYKPLYFLWKKYYRIQDEKQNKINQFL